MDLSLMTISELEAAGKVTTQVTETGALLITIPIKTIDEIQAAQK